MKNEFESAIRELGFDQPVPPLLWFYTVIVSKETQKYRGSIILQADGWGNVIKMLFENKLMPENSTVAPKPTEIPKDKLPPEEYRNRLLTRAEVETMWPWMKTNT